MTPIHHPVVGAVGFTVSGAFAMIGTALSIVNPILQGVAYCVSIIVGLVTLTRLLKK